ncbi:MAG TPA: D-alanyl-D-alanine carboxypeptidase/D-alanyl-D-alanine-endopeptidase [Casimicrobiaceae bacterium]|nr:D-alanyl-D-alanine carboxypeptidase/D-alanyl-D-alanine-endopeptidase [Casimicrobiaceae bacterium]
MRSDGPLRRSIGPTRLVCIAALALVTLAGAGEAALPQPVERAFRDAKIPLGSVGIVVQEVNGRRPLFAQQIDRPFNPASVMKLVTTLAALELLGPDYRWKTDAYLGGTLERGVLHGDLLLKGGGDPKITVEQWQAFMATLRARGLEAVDGDLVLDRTFFAPIAHDPAAFDREPLKPYNVGPDALLVNFKSVRFGFAPPAAGDAPVVTVEPALSNITVSAQPQLSSGDCSDWRSNLHALFTDQGVRAEAAFPGRYSAACGERELWVALLNHPVYVHAMFDAYFRAAGGIFAGGWRSGAAPRGAAPFATLESPPLWDIVRDVNKMSNNVMARQIFLTLSTVDAPPPATTAHAAQTVRRWLASQQIKAPELVLENGSGLSRRERISAGSLAKLLIAADKSNVRDEFASSLAVAAMDGTVQRRFQDGTVAGQALLKTGTLEGVRALAGYVLDRDGRRFAVVAIVNGPSASRAQAALDYLVQWVYRDAAVWAATSR